ncbi:MAG: FtsQ-type POTRA domain-containing protein [Firmicutes bacterium]|nr:FtsQ-type POTRA domain-containing protein [Candidatus Colivicinus equi]
MLDEQEKKMIDNIPFVHERKQQKDNYQFNKIKRRYFILSIFLSLAVIAAVYLLSNRSNVFSISVNGNYYLSDDDIISTSELSTSSKYLFVFPSIVEKRILSNPLVEECEVSLLDNNLVSIDIREKKIVGYIFEDSNYQILTIDNDKIELTTDNAYLINKIPLIEGFIEDDLILIEKQMENLDSDLINEVSEIHYYAPLKYQYVEVIMRDGNYIFTSPYGLDILNKYYDMESSYGMSKDSCFYFEDISGNAYVSNCPWEKEVEEVKPEQVIEDVE